MLRLMGWICGFALFTGFSTVNAVGYCVPQATKYSHEDAIVFALHDAANSTSSIIPEIATLADAREYFETNPDCCFGGRVEKPVRSIFGLFKGYYVAILPVMGGSENLHLEFVYELANCLKIRKISSIGYTPK